MRELEPMILARVYVLLWMGSEGRSRIGVTIILNLVYLNRVCD